MCPGYFWDLSGLVHIFLNCLASNIITLEDANNMSNGMINTGLRWILKEKYGTTIGFKKMVNLTIVSTVIW